MSAKNGVGMLFGKYTFHCVMQTSAELPPYKGSTFRGVFGQALKRVVCALRHNECPACLLRERCIYTRVFETGLVNPTRSGGRVTPTPHPFVIEPPLDSRMCYAPGDTFSCSLLLFGEAVNCLPYFVYAVHQMGEIGVGRKIHGRRGRFRLQSVMSGEKAIYRSDENTIRQDGTVKEISVDGGINFSPGVVRIKVVMMTPLRIKFENSLKSELPYHILVRAVLRRLASLFSAHGGGEPPLDFKGLIRAAEEVPITENHAEWFDWDRYSSRQERKMALGGIRGAVIYDKVPASHIPLLGLGERFHLGKATSFGLGKIGVRKLD